MQTESGLPVNGRDYSRAPQEWTPHISLLKQPAQ